jgi:hypothetical protein
LETYFKIKIFVEFILPIIIIGLLLIFFIRGIVISSMKAKLMKKLGYEYKKGLGTNVALEFQSRWVKGNIKIYSRKVDALKYSKLKSFVKSNESK